VDAGRPAEAVRLCDQHLPRHTNNPKLHTNCAIVYEQLHRDREAEASYRAAVANGLGSVALANLGRFLSNSGRRAEAEKFYLAAIEKENIPARKHFRRGRFLLRFYPQRSAEAAEEFRRALELQPRFASARAALDDLLSAPTNLQPEH